MTNQGEREDAIATLKAKAIAAHSERQSGLMVPLPDALAIVAALTAELALWRDEDVGARMVALTATVEAQEGEIEAAAAEACDYCRHKCELHRGEYGWLHTYNAVGVDCGAESIHQRAWARTQREAGQ